MFDSNCMAPSTCPAGAPVALSGKPTAGKPPQRFMMPPVTNVGPSPVCGPASNGQARTEPKRYVMAPPPPQPTHAHDGNGSLASAACSSGCAPTPPVSSTSGEETAPLPQAPIPDEAHNPDNPAPTDADTRVSLSPAVVVNLNTLQVGNVVVDWPATKTALQNEAIAQGWKLCSKVQQAQGGGHRGWCRCSHAGCLWGFKLCKERASVLMPISDVIDEHNHEFKVKTDLPAKYSTSVGGSQKVKRSLLNEMTTDEVAYARRQARHIKTPKRLARAMADYAMEMGLGEIAYTSHLMSSIIASVGEVTGTTGHQLKELLDLGSVIKAKGGFFDYQLDEENTLTCLAIQTALMREYSKAYGDFNLQDGTHSINRYNEILVPTCVVDCLGRTRMAALCLLDSENAPELLTMCQGLETLLRKGATYMTDEAGAFAVIASHFEMTHLLCVDHFKTKIFGASGNLGPLHDDFVKDISKALFEDLGLVKRLDCHLGVMAQTYKPPAALELIREVDEKKDRVCFTCTKVHFTAGHVATQRIEGNNSCIKEKGDLKKDLKKMNNYTLVRHVLDMAEHKELDAVDEIKRLVEHGKKWSDYVDTRWKESGHRCSDIRECVKVRQEADLLGKGRGTVWSVPSRTGIDEKDHIVCTWINHEAPNARSRHPPSCDCGRFTSSGIPCAHICYVFTVSKNALWDELNLAPRWRLSSHPLCDHARSKLNISAIPNTTCTSTTEPVVDTIKVGTGTIRLSEYHAVKYYSDRARRSGELGRRAKHLQDLLLPASEHAYKLAICGLDVLLNQVRDEMKATPSDSTKRPPLDTTVQPQCKRARLSTAADEAAAMSTLNDIRGKSKPKHKKRHRLGNYPCKACERHGIHDTTHRSKSQKCDFSSCQCPACNPSNIGGQHVCQCKGCLRLSNAHNVGS